MGRVVAGEMRPWGISGLVLLLAAGAAAGGCSGTSRAPVRGGAGGDPQAPGGAGPTSHAGSSSDGSTSASAGEQGSYGGGALPQGGQAGDDTAGAAGAGLGGAPDDGLRPIVARFLSKLGRNAPAHGVRLILDGVEHEADDEGIVRARVPAGPYDAIVIDSVSAFDTVPVDVWRGLTTDEPVFVLWNGDDAQGPQGLPWHGVQGQLNGNSVSSRGAGFWNDSGHSRATLGSSDDFDVQFDGPLPRLDGTLVGLASNGTDFWYGQRSLTLTSQVIKDVLLTVALVPSREVSVTFALPQDYKASAWLELGPFALEQADSIGALQGTVRVPYVGSPSPLPMTIGLKCSEKTPSTGSSEGYAAITDASSVTVACPQLVELEAPLGGSYASDTPFVLQPPAPACNQLHVVSGSYEVTVHTTEASFSLPNLEAWGISRPAAGKASAELTSAGPCTNVYEADQPPFRAHWQTYVASEITLQ